MPLRTVAVLLTERPLAFEFGVLAEVFGIDRTADGVPPFEFRASAEPMTPRSAVWSSEPTPTSRPSDRVSPSPWTTG